MTQVIDSGPMAGCKFIAPVVKVAATPRRFTIWKARVEDLKGKIHEFFIKISIGCGEEEVREHALMLSRNWKLLSLEATTMTAPAPGWKPIPAEAHEPGIMKALNKLRRR